MSSMLVEHMLSSQNACFLLTERILRALCYNNDNYYARCMHQQIYIIDACNHLIIPK